MKTIVINIEQLELDLIDKHSIHTGRFPPSDFCNKREKLFEIFRLIKEYEVKEDRYNEFTKE